MKGYHALVLHAHLPFVRHPEHDQFLEEDWLYEAIVETYVPLLDKLGGLLDDGIRGFELTMTLSPPLVAMLRDPLLQQRAERELDKLCELAAKEVDRTAKDATLNPVARFYLQRFERIRALYVHTYKRDLVGAFRKFADEGVLEIITCGATHGFLPLMQLHPEAVRAQVKVAVQSHIANFGKAPRGIWLPECGFYPGVEKFLAAEGIRFFFVDTHGVLDATPRPRYGVYAPIFTPSGVAAFARDQESSVQVWSSERGYPGDPVYRDFYRDIGWDLPMDYVKPYIQPTGDRKNTGIKYHRVTGKVPLGDKLPYNPWVAQERAAIHAGNFLFNRERQVEQLASALGRPPMVVSPYDAELFGHWWYEGPEFLDAYIRKVTFDQQTYRLVSPATYLNEQPEQQVATPPLCSWGAQGYAGVWLEPGNDWVYRHLHKAAERMIGLARDYRAPTALERRALNQAARELLLAQSSDWAFIMHTGTMVPYAEKRTKEHVDGFTQLHDAIRAGTIDTAKLEAMESRTPIFPELDYGVYAPA